MNRHNFIISLGSNLGDRLSFLQQSVKKISEINHTEILRYSSIYETRPLGPAEKPFYNAVIAGNTSINDPCPFLGTLREIEDQLGRQRSHRWGDRSIDVDLLLFGDVCANTPKLQLPHPSLLDRDFVMLPALEVAADFFHPLAQVSLDTAWKTRSELAFHSHPKIVHHPHLLKGTT